MTLSRILATLPGRAWPASPLPGGPAGPLPDHPGAVTSPAGPPPARRPPALRPGGRPAAGRRCGRRRWRAGRGCGAASTPRSPPVPAPSRSWPRRRPTRPAAAALWGHLAGLLRPPLGAAAGTASRTWAGSTPGPAARGGMAIRLWVPGTIPPGMIERAVEAAWPGAHTRTTSAASPPLPPGGLTAGGTLRLARPEILPLGPVTMTPTPAAGAGRRRRRAWATASTPSSRSSPGPVTGARLRRARRAARQPARRAARPADRPGCWTWPAPAATPAAAPAAPRPAPTRSWPPRSAPPPSKLAGPQWETLIRYGVATTAAPVPAGPGAGRHAPPPRRPAARLRGLAHALASATALYAGRNWLARRHLRHPAARDRRPPAAPRRPAVGPRTRRDRPAARRPGAARPGPRRGPRRPPAARHPGPRPARPAARRLRRRSAAPGRRSPSPTPVTTCGSAGRPAPARPP